MMQDAVPRVTVVIPTRNRAALLPRSLRGVLAQTFADFEVVVVDDASSDDTPSVLRQIAAADPRVRVVRTAAPSGAAEARNRGVAEARGEWIAFQDDDDEWLPEKLERQLQAAARNPDAGVVYCPYLYRTDDGEVVRGAFDPDSPPGARRMIFRRSFIGVPTLLVRRDLFWEVGGFDRKLAIIEDWDLFIRLSAATRFVWVPEPLVRVNATPDSLSQQTRLFVRSARRLLAKLERAEGVTAEERAHALYSIGHLLVWMGVRSAGVRALLRSLRMHPWRWQRYGMLLAACLGPGVHRRAVAFVMDAEARRWKRSRSQAAATPAGTRA